MVEVETVSGVAVNADCGVVDDRDLYCAMRQRREARQPRGGTMPEEVVGERETTLGFWQRSETRKRG